MSKRLSGLNPLSYQGVEPLSPPQMIEVARRPHNPQDNKSFNIGTFWVVKGASELWLLISLAAGEATWIQLYPSFTGAASFPCDVGIANEVGGVINILGGNNAFTTGMGNTITIGTTGNVADEFIGDIGSATPALNNINIFGANRFSTTGAGNTVTIDLDQGTDGQVIIAGGADPIWANITSSGATVTITNGPSSIDLSVPGIPGTQQYITDAGIAVPAGSIIKFLGSTNINTAAGGNLIAVNLDDDILIAGSLSTGTTITAGTGLIVNSGGITSTGTTTLNSLSTGILQTNAIGTVSSTNGTDGQLLIGGGTNAAWSTVTSSGGTVTITGGANTLNLEVIGSISRQPFLACHNASYNSTFAAGYYLGTSLALTEIYDDGNNFYPGSGVGAAATFTAPATGQYYLEVAMQLRNQSDALTNLIFEIAIVTTARTYTRTQKWFRSSAIVDRRLENNFSTIADMTASDTAQFYIILTPSTAGRTFDLYGNGTAELYTFVSGYRVG